MHPPFGKPFVRATANKPVTRESLQRFAAVPAMFREKPTVQGPEDACTR